MWRLFFLNIFIRLWIHKISHTVLHYERYDWSDKNTLAEDKITFALLFIVSTTHGKSNSFTQRSTSNFNAPEFREIFLKVTLINVGIVLLLWRYLISRIVRHQYVDGFRLMDFQVPNVLNLQVISVVELLEVNPHNIYRM